MSCYKLNKCPLGPDLANLMLHMYSVPDSTLSQLIIWLANLMLHMYSVPDSTLSQLIIWLKFQLEFATFTLRIFLNTQ